MKEYVRYLRSKKVYTRLQYDNKSEKEKQRFRLEKALQVTMTKSETVLYQFNFINLTHCHNSIMVIMEAKTRPYTQQHQFRMCGQGL